MEPDRHSDEPDTYALGVIASGRTFDLHHSLTEAEWSQLENATLAVARIAVPFHYNLVERNFLQLKHIHQYVSITISLGRNFASPDRRMLGESVMTATVNWLTAMRMFLDHEAAELKRRFGRKSPELRRFEEAKSSAYTGEVGYRFASQFRNYVQHVGLPLSHIQVDPTPTPSPRFRQVARLLLDRETLLSEYNQWFDVQADLEAMPPTFELLPLLAGAMTGLRAVNHACTEIDLDQALASVPTLATALDRLDGLEGEPTLFRYARNDKGGLSITPRPLQASAVRTLQTVVEGRATRESLWAIHDDDPTDPPLDPAFVREKFHRDNRGVQVMAAWLQEGGGTPGFFEVVNEFIREDNGIEPVLTGLINSSTVLMHMAAGALGTTAEALLAAIIDHYGEADEPPTLNGT